MYTHACIRTHAHSHAHPHPHPHPHPPVHQSLCVNAWPSSFATKNMPTSNENQCTHIQAHAQKLIRQAQIHVHTKESSPKDAHKDARKCTYTDDYTHTHTHAHMHTYTNTHTYEHTQTHFQTQTRTNSQMHTSTRTHQTNAHTHTNTHSHISKSQYTQGSLLRCAVAHAVSCVYIFLRTHTHTLILLNFQIRGHSGYIQLHTPHTLMHMHPHTHSHSHSHIHTHTRTHAHARTHTGV